MAVIIIAEAGVNHNGDIRKAEQLIDAAVQAGADYVKFQTFKADKLVSKSAPKASYQQKNINDGDDTQYTMLKKLELSEEDHIRLSQYATSKKIKFLSTAFDLDSIDFLETLGIDTFKIPSGEITNYPYLVRIAKTGKPVILSTGMAYMKEIQDAVTVLSNHGVPKEKIIILHCNTEYPTPFEDVNLKAMLTIGSQFGVSYGYSDHTTGIEVPIAAVALGAVVIEKHFTLDRTLPGPDHKASLEPQELHAMVAGIRNIEKALRGNGVKEPSTSEAKNIVIARKSIHIHMDIAERTVLTEQHLIMQRPGDGISPMEMNEVIGKRVLTNLKAGHKLSWADLQ
jgi:N-acetylneuraminate synthase/N,N'-diacetyllegionaminate synthase